MNTKRIVNTLQWWCKNCGGEGEIYYNDNWHDKPVLVICSHCSSPSAYVWCEECGMGGQFAENGFEDEPMYWICQECHTKYQLPESFYHHPTFFSPKTFADIDKLNKIEAEREYIKEYKYITPDSLRNFFLRLDKIDFVKQILVFILSIFFISALSQSVALGLALSIGLFALFRLLPAAIKEVFLLKYLFIRSKRITDKSAISHIPKCLQGGIHTWYKYAQFVRRLFSLAFLSIFFTQIFLVFFIPNWVKTKISLGFGITLIVLIALAVVYSVINFIIFLAVEIPLFLQRKRGG